jgi:hypothetical protein
MLFRPLYLSPKRASQTLGIVITWAMGMESDLRS